MEPCPDLDHVVFSVDAEVYETTGFDKVETVADWSAPYGVSAVTVDVRDGSVPETSAICSGVECKVESTDGRGEFVESLRSLADEVADGLTPDALTEAELERRLPDRPEADLVVRTGRARLVNTMLWRSVYSEIRFVESWRELDRDDLEGLMEDFADTERRYGR